jgi:hypothetical protein
MSLLPIGIGTLIGLALFGVGVVQLFARERLVLDRSTGRGTYQSNSPIVTSEKPFKFKIENVNSVVISQETVGTYVAGIDPGMSESKVYKALLRVSRPRRAVIIDETQNGRNERVVKMAETIAEFLGKRVERS